jgi:urea carboxylase
VTATEAPAEVAPDAPAATVEVLDGGPLTTVQDLPGRFGYWDVGVPPSGPMDDLTHRLVNRVVGNDENAAALELTTAGPVLRAGAPLTIAVGGAAMPTTVDGVAVPAWTAVEVAAGALIRVGAVAGPGMRATLAVRGGFAVAPYLGSCSTFTLGGFGGHEGRPLTTGDVLTVGPPPAGPVGTLPPGLAPQLAHEWELGVLVGPHAAPDFLTVDGLEALLRAEWRVHFNSARTGVRLIGPRPAWARGDGGEAGLHPSNIHDTGYAIGAVDLTGDMPIILGPDGPSLGGFVSPAVVVATERWKLGQLAPGDRVRLLPWTADAAARADGQRAAWLARATSPAEPLVRPAWNRPLPRPARRDDAVLARREPAGTHPGTTYRRAGDRFLLVEYGPMVLDLALRVRVHVLERWVREHLPEVVDVTAGVRSLLVQVDGRRLTVDGAQRILAAGEDDLGDVEHTALPSRVVHLPLSWDDPATRDAIERYVHGVRADAPWCEPSESSSERTIQNGEPSESSSERTIQNGEPSESSSERTIQNGEPSESSSERTIQNGPWNIEFIRRINGLADVADVHRTVFDASYLVVGLGDVYLGAPVATPLDPRHRLVTTKYNPARTWTPENAVGIGGAYLCIYGMEGPGGYQFVGRTVQVWNRDCRGPLFERPWLLRPFDQLRFHPVTAAELLDQRAEQAAGRLEIGIQEGAFRLADHRAFLAAHADDIAAFRTTQQAAFAAERAAWATSGESGR